MDIEPPGSWRTLELPSCLPRKRSRLTTPPGIRVCPPTWRLKSGGTSGTTATSRMFGEHRFSTALLLKIVCVRALGCLMAFSMNGQHLFYQDVEVLQYNGGEILDKKVCKKWRYSNDLITVIQRMVSPLEK